MTTVEAVPLVNRQRRCVTSWGGPERPSNYELSSNYIHSTEFVQGPRDSTAALTVDAAGQVAEVNNGLRVDLHGSPPPTVGAASRRRLTAPQVSNALVTDAVSNNARGQAREDNRGRLQYRARPADTQHWHLGRVTSRAGANKVPNRSTPNHPYDQCGRSLARAPRGDRRRSARSVRPGLALRAPAELSVVRALFRQAAISRSTPPSANCTRFRSSSTDKPQQLNIIRASQVHSGALPHAAARLNRKQPTMVLLVGRHRLRGQRS